MNLKEIIAESIEISSCESSRKKSNNLTVLRSSFVKNIVKSPFLRNCIFLNLSKMEYRENVRF